MYRGTTPTFKFTLPFEVGTLKAAYISIEQNRRVMLEKSIEECTLSDKTISVKLTQEETLKLLVQDQTKIILRSTFSFRRTRNSSPSFTRERPWTRDLTRTPISM